MHACHARLLGGSVLVLAAIAGAGCSAIVTPDPGRFDDPSGVDGGGGGVDAGGGGDVDGGGGELDAGGEIDGGGGEVDSGGGELDGGGGPCTPGCSGGVLTRCEGGAPIVEDCALGCAPGGARCLEMVPSNVEAGLWSAEARDVTISGAGAQFDTSECRSVMTRSQIVTQERGPALCVLQVRNLRVEAGATLAVAGTLPLVIMATGEVDIYGTLDLSATLDRPGAGGGLGGRPGMSGGNGWGPGGGGGRSGMFDDGGGGGGGLCGAGGAGGRGGNAAGGAAGVSVAADLLIPLRGGSGGGIGSGSGPSAGSAGTVGLGGAGGGAVQISARGRIVIGGTILAAGGGGRGGLQSGGSNWGAGGGGGSGGAILLEAPEVVFGAASALGTSGGGGGGSAGQSGRGGDGADGRTTFETAGGGAGNGTFSAAGGDSGGGSLALGSDGGDNLSNGANGGGGGGGAGCIVVRNASGELPPGVSEGWSPNGEGVDVAPVTTR